MSRKNKKDTAVSFLFFSFPASLRGRSFWKEFYASAAGVGFFEALGALLADFLAGATF